MNFIETRGNDGIKPIEVPFSEAILNPITSFGGLYVPAYLPKLENNFVLNHVNSSYKELAFDILKAFEIDIDESEINKALPSGHSTFLLIKTIVAAECKALS